MDPVFMKRSAKICRIFSRQSNPFQQQTLNICVIFMRCIQMPEFIHNLWTNCLRLRIVHSLWTIWSRSSTFRGDITDAYWINVAMWNDSRHWYRVVRPRHWYRVPLQCEARRMIFEVPFWNLKDGGANGKYQTRTND